MLRLFDVSQLSDLERFTHRAKNLWDRDVGDI